MFHFVTCEAGKKFINISLKYSKSSTIIEQDDQGFKTVKWNP